MFPYIGTQPSLPRRDGHVEIDVTGHEAILRAFTEDEFAEVFDQIFWNLWDHPGGCWRVELLSSSEIPEKLWKKCGCDVIIIHG